VKNLFKHIFGGGSKFTFTIRTKFIIIFTILVGLICVFIYAYLPIILETQAIQSIADKARSINDMTAFNVSSTLLFEDKKDMKEILDGVKQNKDLAYLVVLDNKGEAFSAINLETALKADYKLLSNNNPITRDKSIYRTRAPIIHKSKTIGDIFLGLFLNDLHAQIEKSRLTITYVSAVIFILGAAAVFLTSTVITRPLKKMAHTMEEISGGDLSKRVTFSSKDEVGNLAQSFNLMVENLETYSGELQELNNTLENRVAERTKTLELEINERKQAQEKINESLQEKELLLKEIHHRVKNNLQIICSLLSLQGDQTSNPEATKALDESQNRIRSMAMIHEILYKSEDFSKIDFGEYIEQLTDFLADSLEETGVPITTEINVDNIFLKLNKAIPCGLIINELFVNSLRHAFPRDTAGKILIDMRKEHNNRLTLTYRDNGKGLPEDFVLGKTPTLGMQLVTDLTRQLGGSIKLEQTGKNKGVGFLIEFPT
jgi:two-component sensor histidine kinase/HAMP domain-containing protein